MEDKIKEIMKLSVFHGFSIETVYSNGDTAKEKAVSLEELQRILEEVLR